MDDSSEKKKLDPELWHACAGGMVQLPPPNTTVFYFPQGHAEHASSAVHFPPSLRIPPLIPCRVSAVHFLADPDSDEVFSKIRLLPLSLDHHHDADAGIEASSEAKPASFAKTLTQSDANNGGGFSVPRYCAETIFPRLDYSADPPVQTVVARDVHGEVWKFRHIYRGTPRRHLLTTGWSSFVNQKKLVAGDAIVFLRAENGELCVGIRRAKRSSEAPLSGWSSSYGGFLREEESNKCCVNGGLRGNSKGRVRAESVVEAASLAAAGRPFEVVYYPRASTPEFCVKASAVRAAIRTEWCSGMRFKMPFETEDSSRISWFMGTIASLQAADRVRWPNSPWRLLQVTWDEPDLLRNVKCVSPWLVELVSNVPVISLSPFLPPRKKLRHPDLPHDGQFPKPLFTGNPLRPSSNAPAGIQGARQNHFGISLSDLHYTNKLQYSGLFHSDFHRFDPRCKIPDGIMARQTNNRHDNLSCLLTMGSSSPRLEKSDSVKKHQFFLFGQPILTEQQMSHTSSGDKVAQVLTGKCSSDDPRGAMGHLSDFSWNHSTEVGIVTGHCKVFMDSEDVGQTLDLSALSSYEELYTRLAIMFGMQKSELLNHVLYRDALGAVRQAGDEPFSDFIKSAKRLTILMDSASNKLRTWITGMQNADNRLNSSNKRGPLSIFV